MDRSASDTSVDSTPPAPPLRLAVFSDLHIDLAGGRARQRWLLERIAVVLEAAAPDVVLFVGDLSNSLEPVRRSLAGLAVGRRANLFVPGNHDAWLSPREIAAGADSDNHLSRFAGLVQAAGWEWLPGAPQLISGWGFAGSLGWFDRSFAEPYLGAGIEQYRAGRFGGAVWNDMNFARFVRDGRRLDDPEVFASCLAELRADLDAIGVSEAGDGPPTVVATHHLAYRELLIGRPWDRGWTFCQAFMGGAGLGELYDARAAVRLVAAGHTHVPRYFEGGDGRHFVVSPIGYEGSGEWPSNYSFEERVAIFDLSASGQVSRLEHTPARS